MLGGHRVCVAGLVVAAAGSVYMYKRIWGSKEAPVITDEQVLTLEDLAHRVGNPDLGQPDQEPSTVLIYEEVQVSSRQLLPCRYSPLYCGSLAIRTNTCRVLMNSERLFQYQTSWSHVTGSKKVETKMHHVCVVQGTESRLWWAMSVERSRPEGNPYTTTTVISVTGIQFLGGQVWQVQSHLCHKTSVSVPFLHYLQTDISIATATLFMGPDGKLSSTAQTFSNPDVTETDGVFEELHSILQVVLPAGQWQAQRYLNKLKAMLLAFLDAIFNLPLDRYYTRL